MDYTGNSSKQWSILATAQNNRLYWQHIKTMDYTGNSSKQWIPKANHSQSAQKPGKQTTKRKPLKYDITTKQEMNNIHLLQPTNTKNHKPFQTN